MPAEKPMHRQVYEHLIQSIVRGEYSTGDQIPTEAELQTKFKTSRITVSRAMRDLAKDGYLIRRRGAGSFVNTSAPVRQLLGMLVPADDMGDVFLAMCGGMMRELEAGGCHLSISNLDRADPSSILRQAETACGRYAAHQVHGVIFVPFSLPPDQMWVNQHIAEMLSTKGLGVVLLDRDCACPPQRSRFDLVGTANRHCGYTLTRHLLDLGRRRIVFVAGSFAASSVSERIAGFHDALTEASLPAGAETVCIIPQLQMEDPREFLKEFEADAYVCMNDQVAVHVTRVLLEMGVCVPREVAVVGIDDVKYASLVPVPLTTMRQPLGNIARAAAKLLLERVAEPHLPPREVSFQCELVVRKSCGADLAAAGTAGAAGAGGGRGAGRKRSR